MKYNIVINQGKAIEWGLNLSEASIFSFLYELPSWAEASPIKSGPFDVWYFCSKNKIIEEFPLLTKKRDTVYRLLKSLVEKGLIFHEFKDGRDWVKLTEKAKTYNDWEGSEKNPTSPRKKIRSTPEKNPTNTSSNDNLTSNTLAGEPAKRTVKDMKIEFCKEVITWNDTNPRKYPKLMLVEFVKYWIETTKNKKSIRYEKEKFFEIGKRLATWFSRASDKDIATGWEQEDKIDPLNVLLRPLL